MWNYINILMKGMWAFSFSKNGSSSHVGFLIKGPMDLIKWKNNIWAYLCVWAARLNNSLIYYFILLFD
jgi:hypothetical protein